MRFADLYPKVGQVSEPGAGEPLAVEDPLAIVTGGGKGTAAYLAHSYPTKVPPEVITPYIEHHTRPGDLVLDPFCGSGMTGVAARRAGRRAVLNDLSVGASHLAANLTTGCEPSALAAAGRSVLATVGDAYDYWYATEGRDGGRARIDWTLWSERYACLGCGNASTLWADAVDRSRGTVAPGWPCPECGQTITKRTAPSLGPVPAWLAISDSAGRHQRAPLPADLERLERIASEPIEDWHPDLELGPEREMYIRCALQRHGVQNVADFWTPRNLRACARLWATIQDWPDLRVRQALALAFTNTVWHATRMRRFNARGGQRPLTGTLYVPQLSIEVNPAGVFANKLTQLRRFYAGEPGVATDVSVLRGPAQSLPLKTDSVHYCFTDPPFGSNIFYADCAVVWESWLGETTDPSGEAVVNRSLKPANGGKSVEDYAELMASAFAELARVLKPDGWSTVVFHSTDPEVWSALRAATERAGFDLASASHIDKTQQSFKGYKGRSGAEDVAAFDVVLNLHKPGATRRAPKPPGGFQEAGNLLEGHLAALPEAGTDLAADRRRGLPFLHSLLVQAHFNGSIGLDVGEYALVRRLCYERFRVDPCGRWSLREAEEERVTATVERP